MPVQLPTLTGQIPEPAERAIRSIAAAVNALEAQVIELAGAVEDPRVPDLQARVSAVVGRVDVLNKQVQSLLNP